MPTYAAFKIRPMTTVITVLFVFLYLGAFFPTRGQTPKTADRNVISILDYGAVRDGSGDSTTAIRSAIIAAKLQKLQVLVPSGTFRHMSFSLDGVTMRGIGPTSVLFATDPQNSNVYLRGKGPTLRNLIVKVRSSVRDSKNFAVYIDGATDFLVESVTVDGGNAGGIFNYGGHNGRIIHNTVQNTLADAIHNTHGAHDIIIGDNTIRHADDDMIAVVSYSDQMRSRNILITHNVLTDSDGGRGIAVSGGQDVTIEDNVVERTACCAGIYLASEAYWDTQDVRNVIVRGNRLADNSGHRTHHGAILIRSDHGSVRDVVVDRNNVFHARYAAIKMSGDVGDISLVDNSLVEPAEEGITGIGSNVFCVGNTLNGWPIATAPCGFARNNVTATGSTLQYPRDPAFCVVCNRASKE